MLDPDLTNITRLIVAQEDAIRKAMNYGHGPEYFIRYYKALSDHQKPIFVAAMASILAIELAQKNAIFNKKTEALKK